VLELRARQQRNFLATLFLSQGVPMLLSGDELGRTQGGNNNAYCQDNRVSWIDWESADDDLLEFTRALIELRHEHPVFRRRRWFHGRSIHGKDHPEIAWFRPDGSEMTEHDWQVGYAKTLGVFLHGESILSRDAYEQQIVDDDFYLMLNAHHGPLEFRLPARLAGWPWLRMIDTAAKPAIASEEPSPAEAAIRLEGRSLVLLRHDRTP